MSGRPGILFARNGFPWYLVRAFDRIVSVVDRLLRGIVLNLSAVFFLVHFRGDSRE